MVMAVSFMMMIVLLSLALPLLSVGTIEPMIAGNILRVNQAQYAAETGAERALAQFIASPALIGSATTTPTTLFAGQAMADGSGSYTVTSQRQGWNAVMIQSTATGQSNAQSVIRTLVTNAYLNNRGILAGQDLSLSTTTNVQGALGSIHTNGNLTLSGSVTVAVDATAKGNYQTSGSVTVNGVSGGQKPTVSVPAITPSSLLSSADYILETSGNNGRVRVAATGQTYSSGWNGWSYNRNSRVWSNSRSSIPAGTYYANQASITITGAAGTAASPWRATLIATNDITITGRVVMAPDTSTSTNMTDVALVAGGDILVNLSSGSATVTGLIGANEQVRINGNVTLNGAIVAAGAANARGAVVSNSVSGNVTISNSRQLRIPLQGPVQVLSWTTVPG
jgi:hypothetical protein